MRIIIHARFAREFKKVPLAVKKRLIEQEALFRQNIFSPRLKTHKLKGPLAGMWSFSVTHEYRIMFEILAENIVRFYSIGNHNIYD